MRNTRPKRCGLPTGGTAQGASQIEIQGYQPGHPSLVALFTLPIFLMYTAKQQPQEFHSH
jgi:hypothetical protein